MSTGQPTLPVVDAKGKGRALPPNFELDSGIPNQDYHGIATNHAESSSMAQWWRHSRETAQADHKSWDYVLSSGVAGGVAGCVAKTAIAPLDRVKILFQTSNAEFRKYAGTPRGLLHATAKIYQTSGVRGLFQGHSATLLRIFPYAGVKFMAYDRAESILIPTPDKRTPARYFVAGAVSGVTSVLLTYPLELIRVRMAYQTRASERTSLREAIRSIYHENHPYAVPTAKSGIASASSASAKSSSASVLSSATASSSAAFSSAATATANQAPTSALSAFTRSIPLYPFYRGFSISIVGMVPYAGVSFLTYGTLKKKVPEWSNYFRGHRTANDLFCGAIAGLLSQTASYPFEVVRRRMQVGGVGGGTGVTWRQAFTAIYAQRGLPGFFVGLTIGYLKVVPMTSISFATWQLMKRVMEI